MNCLIKTVHLSSTKFFLSPVGIFSSSPGLHCLSYFFSGNKGQTNQVSKFGIVVIITVHGI